MTKIKDLYHEIQKRVEHLNELNSETNRVIGEIQLMRRAYALVKEDNDPQLTTPEGLLICSLHNGYFVAQNAYEVHLCQQNKKKQAESNLRRAHKLGQRLRIK